MEKYAKREGQGAPARIMNIVTRSHLIGARELDAWYKVAGAARWRDFVEVRQTYCQLERAISCFTGSILARGFSRSKNGGLALNFILLL